MNVIQALTLGVTQGLTEFLPISSSAHLVLVPWFLGWEDPGLAFDTALHAGTLVAVMAYFRQDLVQLALSWVKSLRGFDRTDPYQKLSWLVIFGCLPAIAAGLLLEGAIATVFRSPYWIAGMMIGVALLIALAEKVTQQVRSWKEMNLKDALVIGAAQACALIPGTSRSGSTIAAGLFMGLKREDAARFSFLLGFPVILGSAVFQGKKLLASPAGSEPLILLLGVAASAISGYFCIRFLIRYLQKHGMAPFIVYRLALGLLILGLLLSGHAPSFAEPGH